MQNLINGGEMNNTEIIKTVQIEQRIDKFVQTVDDMQDLVKVETLDAIKGLLEMGTIRNWGYLSVRPLIQ